MYHLNNNEKGYILITAMLILVVVTLLGIWALQSTSFEIKIAGNQQRWNENFHISDGAVKQVAGDLGYANSSSFSWYQISDPNNHNQELLPDNSNFDPGNDMSISSDFNSNFEKDDPKFWPHDNLMNDTSDNNYDYSYLVTYLYPDSPPKGYDASNFSGYKFKINTNKKTTIEVGGMKVGVKKSL